MQTLQAHLCADEVVVMTVDTRTGRLNLRDTGDLAAANRGRRFTVITDRLNDNPTILYEALSRLKLGVSAVLFHYVSGGLMHKLCADHPRPR